MRAGTANRAPKRKLLLCVDDGDEDSYVRTTALTEDMAGGGDNGVHSQRQAMGAARATTSHGAQKPVPVVAETSRNLINFAYLLG
ncbi:hypothetical protein HYH02_000530 [Chlamydomonas schloesseri]|uniref:Uncharacterized protein n=1 Tax=Chlamydomonas schloesseri TaxID=2026947 RepID=A0A835WVB3_9CHLO|nr:hypothetical protein HYH02_000530 [Chlamydomonas schloesseri]|eukprot:KAG2454692.1 hypothetical protein HYH02_000530 [Chlamydomonas schloesseri]